MTKLEYKVLKAIEDAHKPEGLHLYEVMRLVELDPLKEYLGFMTKLVNRGWVYESFNNRYGITMYGSDLLKIKENENMTNNDKKPSGRA